MLSRFNYVNLDNNSNENVTKKSLMSRTVAMHGL